MMRSPTHWFFIALLLMLPMVAHAQFPKPLGPTTATPIFLVDPISGATTGINPTALANQGTLSVTQTAKVLSSANTAMTTGTFPSGNLPTNTLRLKSQPDSGGYLSVCWYGAVCTATNGERIAAGESRTISLPSFATAPPQFYCVTGTCYVEIEW